MSLSPEQVKMLLLGSIPPFIIAAIVYFIMAPSKPAVPEAASGRLPRAKLLWLSPLLLLALFLPIQPVIAGKFVLYPKSASEWSPLVAIIATVLSLVAIALPRPGLWRLLARFGLLVTLGGFIAQNFLTRWSVVETCVWLSCFGILGTVAWFSLSHVVALNQGVSSSGVLAIFCLAGAVACEPGLSSLPSAQFIGIIAWSLLGISVAGLFRRGLRLGENATHVPVLITSCIVFAAAIGASGASGADKLLYGALVALVPVLPFFVDAIWTPGPPSRARTILRLKLALLPLVALVAITAWRALEAAKNDPY